MSLPTSFRTAANSENVTITDSKVQFWSNSVYPRLLNTSVYFTSISLISTFPFMIHGEEHLFVCFWST